MNKSELRKTMRNIPINKNYLVSQENILLQQLAKAIELKNPSCVGLFSPLPNEICLNSIFTTLNFQFAYPRIQKNTLKFHEVNNLSELHPTPPYGILEPNINSKTVTPDIIVAPGLAFTIKGTRLGRGKGYYDNYLRNNPCFTISLAFSWQLLEKIPNNSFDVPIDLILNTK